MRVDNFILTQFQTCPAKFELRAIEHWTSRRKTGALGFGAALHEGLAEWYKTGSQEGALMQIHRLWPDNMPIDDWRTKEKCMKVMAEYIRTYPSENFSIVGMPDHPMIECTFTLDTGMHLSCFACGPGYEEGSTCLKCDHPLEPIEYGGIFDGLIEFSGSVYILEHKTTSMLGGYYFNQFKPNNQVTGYVWAAGLMSGQRVGGAMINAIGLYKSSPTKFERQLTSRSQNEIDEWLGNVRATCELIQHCKRTGHWPMHTAACTLYGKCEYHDVHVLGTENERRKRLETDYIREEWNFENRDDVKETTNA